MFPLLPQQSIITSKQTCHNLLTIANRRHSEEGSKFWAESGRNSQPRPITSASVDPRHVRTSRETQQRAVRTTARCHGSDQQIPYDLPIPVLRRTEKDSVLPPQRESIPV